MGTMAFWWSVPLGLSWCAAACALIQSSAPVPRRLTRACSPTAQPQKAQHRAPVAALQSKCIWEVLGMHIHYMHMLTCLHVTCACTCTCAGTCTCTLQVRRCIC